MLKFLPLSRLLSRSGLLFISFIAPLVCTADTQTLLIGYQGEPNTSSEKGSKRGILEANLQGEFLGVEYKLLPLSEMSKNNGSAPRVIIVAAQDDEVLRVASKYSNVPVINILSTGDRLRAVCMPNLFHTMPSQQMFSDALAQWRTKNPDSNATTRAWHKTFRKYAAAQLNIRFRETFNVDMDDDAWAGWAATKLVADTLIRSPSLANDALIAELKTNLAFDGQKGIDMSFRETGQLAQPLLLIENEKISGEAPVRGVVKITDLDSLGVINCPK